jgi:hypothetical protein
MSKAPSDTQFSIVGLEVELDTGRTERSRDFIVEIVDMFLELSLALSGGKVEGEHLGILGDLELPRRLPAVVLLVHEVAIPGFVSEDTEVLEELERNGLGDDCSSGLRGHIRVIVIIDMSSPLFLET